MLIIHYNTDYWSVCESVLYSTQLKCRGLNNAIDSYKELKSTDSSKLNE